MNVWDTFPKEFLLRLQKIIPDSSVKKVMNSFSSKKLTSLRVNKLKTTKEKLIDELTKNNFHLKTIPWFKDAFIVKELPEMRITDLEPYKNGEFYVQSLSSMIPPLVLNPQKNEKILDLCAAPGSKTTQIAALMENTGEIVANDNSRIRVFKLNANLKMQGVTNTKIIISDGQGLWQNYKEYFDKALVDVPCSMEGRFYTQDPKTFSFWSVKKIKELVHRQKFLLRSAVSATKVGGTVVYSTCTLAPEENEGVIDWILKKERNNIQLENVEFAGLEMIPGLLTWNTKVYDNAVRYTKRIYPSNIMEGFFIAKIRKIKSNTINYDLQK